MAHGCGDVHQVQYGAEEVMKREYGDYITETEADYSISLSLEISALPQSAEERAALVKSCSLMKRNAMAAPFERAFDYQKQLESNPPEAGETSPLMRIMSIHYRSVLGHHTTWVLGQLILIVPHQTRRSNIPMSRNRSSDGHL